MPTRVKLYVSVVAVLAIAVLLVAGWQFTAEEPRAHWNALVAFGLLAFASEASYLRLRVGRSETESSITFIPLIASIQLFDTGWAALAMGLAIVAAEVGVKHKPPIKVVFNVGQQMLSVVAAAWIYHSMGGTSSLGSFELSIVAVLPAVATYFLLNSTAVSLAVSLSDGVPFRAAWVRIAGASLLYDLVTSALGPLLAYLYVQVQLLGMLIVIVPLMLVRHMYHMFLQLEQVNRDLLELMVKAIEARDPYTSGHSQRVSKIAVLLARQLGLNAKLAEQIGTAALLHDVGKIHEEYAPLLRKEGKLDATERALMQTHSSRSAELAGTISAFRGTIVDAVRHHHENFDGSGYPAGTAGRAIPVGARIIMIADTVDAMTTDRPYRSALTFERVAQELRRYAGKQFDPEMVEVFLRSPSIRGLVENRAAMAPQPSSQQPSTLGLGWRKRRQAPEEVLG